jgi:hypothetical protein
MLRHDVIIMSTPSNNPTNHRSPLLDSGASPLPVVVRWYVAVLLMVILLALTTHFFLQQQSTLQVQTLVQDLAKKHGWKLGGVRLHMLRGALTLRDLEIKQDSLHIQLPFLLLRGHFSEEIQDIRLTEIRMQRGRIDWRLTEQLSLYDWASLPLSDVLPEQWSALLQPAHHILLDELDVHIHLANEHGDHMPPHIQGGELHLERVYIQGEGQAGNRTWFASSQGRLGLLQWRSVASGSRLDWQDIKAERLLHAVRPQQTSFTSKARIKGHMLWQAQHLSGAMDWQNMPHSGRLAWQGQQTSMDKPFNLTLHAVDWPAVMLPFAVPDIRHCMWQQGRLNGVTQLHIQPDDWQFKSTLLSLDDVRTEDVHGERCWQFSKAELEDVTVASQQHTVTVEHLQLTGGTWMLPHELDPAVSVNPWLIQQAKVDFQDMTLQDTEQGIALRDLYGEATLQAGQWRLTAASPGSEVDSLARWHIQADNQKQHQGRDNTSTLFSYNAHGEGLSPTLFRRLLPTRLTENATLNAQVQVQITGGVRVNAEDNSASTLAWYGSADALVQHFSWERDGWQALIDQIRIDHLQFDEGHGRRMDALHIGAWALHAPLTPLTEPNSMAEPWQPFWLDDWSIKRVTVAAGSWSIGWHDAVWMKLDPFVVTPLQAPLPITVQWAGSLLDGELQASMVWLPWQPPGSLNMQLSLRHGLPFVANRWLLESDIPDFIRGRINLDFHLVSVADDDYSYHGQLEARLAHASMAQGVYQSDSFLRLAGIDPRSLLKRLADDEQLTLTVPIQGNWQTTPLTWGALGTASLNAMKMQYQRHPPIRTVRHDNKKLAYIRLHQEDGLWPNERARIKEVIRTLRASPLLVLELVPQLGRHDLDASFVATARRTQQLIEDYMRERHISPERIIPLWPQKSHKAGGEAGIRLQMYTPQSIVE